MDIANILSILSTLIISIFLPRLIAYVAVSDKRWLNMLIAYGTSAIVGSISAFLAGDFQGDLASNLATAWAATQAAYTLYWKEHIPPELKPVSETKNLPDSH